MAKRFVTKIISARIYDTRSYRYIVSEDKILRLPIADLNTTSAIDGWETVCTL